MFKRILNLRASNFFSDINLTFFFMIGAVRFTAVTFFTAGGVVVAGFVLADAFFTFFAGAVCFLLLD